jgi:hypothetical protein
MIASYLAVGRSKVTIMEYFASNTHGASYSFTLLSLYPKQIALCIDHMKMLVVPRTIVTVVAKINFLWPGLELRCPVHRRSYLATGFIGLFQPHIIIIIIIIIIILGSIA